MALVSVRQPMTNFGRNRPIYARPSMRDRSPHPEKDRTSIKRGVAAIGGAFEAAREGARRLGLRYDRARTCAAGHNARMAKEADSQAPASVADLFKDEALYGDPEAARRALLDRFLDRFDDIIANAIQTALEMRRVETVRKNGALGGRKSVWSDDEHLVIERVLRRWPWSRAAFFKQLGSHIVRSRKAQGIKPRFDLSKRRNYARALERRHTDWQKRQVIEPRKRRDRTR